jgi:hypothetical protein
MTKPSTERPPLLKPNPDRSSNYHEPDVILDGFDADHFYARVRSHSYPGTLYEIEGDVRTGEVRCSCMDASCRRRRGTVLDQSAGCKHIADFWDEINALNALLDWDL